MGKRSNNKLKRVKTKRKVEVEIVGLIQKRMGPLMMALTKLWNRPLQAIVAAGSNAETNDPSLWCTSEYTYLPCKMATQHGVWLFSPTSTRASWRKFISRNNQPHSDFYFIFILFFELRSPYNNTFKRFRSKIKKKVIFL